MARNTSLTALSAQSAQWRRNALIAPVGLSGTASKAERRFFVVRIVPARREFRPSLTGPLKLNRLRVACVRAL